MMTRRDWKMTSQCMQKSVLEPIGHIGLLVAKETRRSEEIPNAAWHPRCQCLRPTPTHTWRRRPAVCRERFLVPIVDEFPNMKQAKPDPFMSSGSNFTRCNPRFLDDSFVVFFSFSIFLPSFYVVFLSVPWCSLHDTTWSTLPRLLPRLETHPWSTWESIRPIFSTVTKKQHSKES